MGYVIKSFTRWPWGREDEADKKRRLREERQAEYAAFLASKSTTTSEIVARNRNRNNDVIPKPTQVDPFKKMYSSQVLFAHI